MMPLFGDDSRNVASNRTLNEESNRIHYVVHCTDHENKKVAAITLMEDKEAIDGIKKNLN